MAKQMEKFKVNLEDFAETTKDEHIIKNKVAASMAKIKIYYNHKNHIFSKLILKCESCIES